MARNREKIAPHSGVPSRATVRYAIYTRTATEQPLPQAFDRLADQRQAGEVYIRSQQDAGGVVVSQHYDDRGYSGANTDRPALKRLLQDIQSGTINCLVVYNLSRLN